MLRGALCLVMALLTVQSASPRFYVESVEVLTEYDSRYILRRTNQIFSSDSPSEQRDIDCFVAELKATGIFADVLTELIPLNNKDLRKVVISTKYVAGVHEFMIGDVVLSDLPEVDSARFHAALSKRGVANHTLLLKYSFTELEERISQALRDVYPNTAEKKAIGSAWVTIRSDGLKRVKLIVSPAYLGCDHAFRKLARGT
jgi:hypothetical protein